MKEMEIGKYNKLPNICVIGNPQQFYLWVADVNNAKASKWFKGKKAFKKYHQLKKLFTKNKKEFIRQVKQLHKENN